MKSSTRVLMMVFALLTAHTYSQAQTPKLIEKLDRIDVLEKVLDVIDLQVRDRNSSYELFSELAARFEVQSWVARGASEKMIEIQLENIAKIIELKPFEQQIADSELLVSYLRASKSASQSVGKTVRFEISAYRLQEILSLRMSPKDTALVQTFFDDLDYECQGRPDLSPGLLATELLTKSRVYNSQTQLPPEAYSLIQNSILWNQ